MPASGRPYERIVDQLRARIDAGEWAPGERIATQRTLASEYGVATETIRRATDQLQDEGLVEARPPRGIFVQRRPSIRRVSTEFHRRRRPATPESTSPFARSAAAAGGQASWDHESTRETADEAVATRLGIEVGAPVMVTRYLYRYDDTPIQTAVSWEPLDLTEGTPVELPEDGAAVGVVARFDLIGIHIDSVVEDLVSRLPRVDEVEALKLSPGVAVMQQQRTYYAGERAVETADIVMAGNRTVLSYRIAVT